LPWTSCRNATSASRFFRPSLMSCSTRRRLNWLNPLWMLYVTTVRPLRAISVRLPFAQHPYRLAVAPREHLFRGLSPAQPAGAQVLAGRHPHLDVARHREPEDVLGIVGHARRVAVPPHRIDFVDVLQVPSLEAVPVGVDARLLGHLADRGIAQALAGILAAGDRLPEARAVGALEQQHLERGGVDD